jgi:hypothetical protein
MNNTIQKSLFIGIIVLAILLVPVIIKAVFWVLLQMFTYPLYSLLISIIVICLISLLPESK